MRTHLSQMKKSAMRIYRIKKPGRIVSSFYYLLDWGAGLFLMSFSCPFGIILIYIL